MKDLQKWARPYVDDEDTRTAVHSILTMGWNGENFASQIDSPDTDIYFIVEGHNKFGDPIWFATDVDATSWWAVYPIAEEGDPVTAESRWRVGEYTVDQFMPEELNLQDRREILDMIMAEMVKFKKLMGVE